MKRIGRQYAERLQRGAELGLLTLGPVQKRRREREWAAAAGSPLGPEKGRERESFFSFVSPFLSSQLHFQILFKAN